MRLLSILTLALAMVGCGGPSQLSVRALAIRPPGLLLSQKSPRVAYLVVAPPNVPTSLPVLVDGADRGGRIVDTDVFVSRDLKAALSTYFNDVRVVAAAPTDSNPHVVIDVRLDRIEVVQTSRRTARPDEKSLGQRAAAIAGVETTVERGAAVMNWSFAIRFSESQNYLFSFAAESPGHTGDDPDFVFRSMFEGAITQLLHAYSEKQVHQAVLAGPAGAKGP
ncbi:MAG: hypothetical protein QM820_01375 [Minicystis sp.]